MGGEAEPRRIICLEAGDFGALLGEGFDDARAAQVLLQPRGEHRELILDGAREWTEAPPEIPGAIGDEGHGPQSEQRQPCIHPQQHHRRADEQHAAFEQSQHSAPGEEAQALHILDGAGEQLPGLRAVMIREGERGELAVQRLAQIVGRALRANLDPAALVVGEHASEQRESEQDERSSGEEAGILRADAFIHDAADELRNQQCQRVDGGE